MTGTETLERPQANQDVEHFDVLIVGAGISGIGSAYHLKDQCPDKSFVVLEAYETFGGTWHMHKYPGVRSDSDLFTFGYRFKPWMSAPIATADEINKYMSEVIDDNDLNQHIRYQHRITFASWSSKDKQWTITATKTDTGETRTFTANFLWMCQGYYDHAKGFTPEWEGMEDFKGQIVHPQTWPEDLDYKGKKVVLIGSGATAATVVPAMANETEHLTMVQRTPTYFFPGQNANELADLLRAVEVDPMTIHDIVRRVALFQQAETCRRALEEPDVLKAELLEGVRAFVGPDFDVDKHLTPPYRPWQQRLAFVPDGDLFKCIVDGKVSIETDTIERFTEKGLILSSGKEIEADIIITATGFNLSVLGNIPFEVDGKPVNWPDTVTYRGMMFTGVPNMLWVFGYFRASWTLRVDLLGDYVCRLLKHMDAKGVKQVTPTIPDSLKDMKIGGWIQEEDFNPNYLKRSMHIMPKAGNHPDWQHTQDYWREKDEIPKLDLDTEAFVYS